MSRRHLNHTCSPHPPAVGNVNLQRINVDVETSANVLDIHPYACGLRPRLGTRSDGKYRPAGRFGCVAAVALLLLAAGMAGKPGVGHAAIEIPVPAWVTTTAIADQMVINGLPSTVRYFHADRPLEEVLAFYRERWDERYAGRAGFREAAVDPWHVISRLDGLYLLTVQARETNALTCEGFLAVADLEDIRKRPARDDSVPQMAGSRVVNDLTSTDPGREGRTLMIVNDFPVSRNRDYYRDYFLDRGWGRLQDQAQGDAHVLSFRRLGKEAHIVIKPTSTGAVTVMNLVTTD